MHRDLAKTGQWGRGSRAIAAGFGRERRPADAPDPPRRGRHGAADGGGEPRHAGDGSVDRAPAEMAVRTALGASRGRLIRQLIVEHIVLAAAGAIAGLLLAWMALPLLTRAIPPEMPRNMRSRSTSPCSTWSSPRRSAFLPCSRSFPHRRGTARAPAAPPTAAERRNPGATPNDGHAGRVEIALAVILGIGASLSARSAVEPAASRSRLRRGVLTFRPQTTSKCSN